MKSIKFSFLFGLAAILLYMLMDVITTVLSLFVGFSNMSFNLNPFHGGEEYLISVSDKNYFIAFFFGFFVAFPIYFIKMRVDRWVGKASVENEDKL
jgi:hypothetical protein